MIETFISHFFTLLNEASPWLILGLIIAGIMKVAMPSQILSQHLGDGKLAIVKAALIGAPLPLCSCGVIPVATELRRSGASKSATASFLVATPETGVDSISVSYALLGPIFAIYRPVAAILSAIITGLLVMFDTSSTQALTSRHTTSCCSTIKTQSPTSCCSSQSTQPKSLSLINKLLKGIHYAATKLFDDLIRWLLLGLMFATVIKTFIPTSFLLTYGSGIGAMLMMIVISIPMYICATASTPIAAGLILAGISPGTALVFMMAGPATNISTLGVIQKELGKSVLIRYLTGVILSAIAFGSLLDWLIRYFTLNINQHMQHSHEVVPEIIAYSCSAILIFLAIKPLRQRCFPTLS